MILEDDGWSVTRQIGLGDIEHVRSGLLSIGCFENRRVIEQVQAAVRLGNELRIMVRIHLNFDRLTPELQSEVLEILRRNATHQLEPWGQLSRERFDRICEGCELLIRTRSAEAGDLSSLLRRAWLTTGARFLNGNFGKLGRSELLERHESFRHDTAEHWENYTS